jgi:hypothetical protein
VSEADRLRSYYERIDEARGKLTEIADVAVRGLGQDTFETAMRELGEIADECFAHWQDLLRAELRAQDDLAAIPLSSRDFCRRLRDVLRVKGATDVRFQHGYGMIGVHVRDGRNTSTQSFMVRGEQYAQQGEGARRTVAELADDLMKPPRRTG